MRLPRSGSGRRVVGLSAGPGDQSSRQVDPGAPPPSGAPGPVQPMEKNGDCSSSGVIPGTDPGVATPNQRMMDPSAAWRFSRGDGQLVAVLDTGVRPGPRLPGVQPGGDYVETTDGLTDCDGHGTLVAGLIAGQPGDDGFAGIAPAARLLSLRVTSAKFSPRTAGRRSDAGTCGRRRGRAGPGDRACGRPGRPGDRHLGDHLPARRSQRRPGRTRRGDPVRGGRQGCGHRRCRRRQRFRRLGFRRSVM